MWMWRKMWRKIGGGEGSERVEEKGDVKMYSHPKV